MELGLLDRYDQSEGEVPNDRPKEGVADPVLAQGADITGDFCIGSANESSFLVIDNHKQQSIWKSTHLNRRY